MKFNYIFIMLLPALHGCGLSSLSQRDTNPNIQDITVSANIFDNIFGHQSVNTFATTASRRLVLVKQTRTTTESCAEPSPDVGESFASAIADGFKLAAKEPKSGITAEVSNQYARAVATQIAPLVYRTQGLQLYRDGIHDLCIAKMNNWISPATYMNEKRELLKAAVKLIENEKSVMEAAQKSFFANVKDKNAAININDFTKIIEAIKPATATTPSCADGKSPVGNPPLCSDGKAPH